MPKSRKSSSGGDGEGPVLSLKLDSKSPGAEPVEVAASGDGFKTPCSFTGVGAGMSGGTLGFVFGFGGYWMRNMLKGKFKASVAEGWNSAKSFAIIGGLYAAVGCFAKRIRQKEDGWNGAAAGCATGLALGWSGGPVSALQSCALFGVVSYFLDGLSGGAPAQASAAEARREGGPCCGLPSPPPSSVPDGRGDSSVTGTAAGSWGQQREAGMADGAGEGPHRVQGGISSPGGWLTGGAGLPGRGQERPSPQAWLEAAWRQLAAQQGQHSAAHSREAVRRLLSPAMPLLSALAPCQFSSGDAGVAGCRVVRGR